MYEMNRTFDLWWAHQIKLRINESCFHQFFSPTIVMIFLTAQNWENKNPYWSKKLYGPNTFFLTYSKLRNIGKKHWWKQDLYIRMSSSLELSFQIKIMAGSKQNLEVGRFVWWFLSLLQMLSLSYPDPMNLVQSCLQHW